MTFGQTATERVSPNMPQFLPWLLDGADENTTVRVLRPDARAGAAHLSRRVATGVRREGLVGDGSMKRRVADGPPGSG